MLILAAAGRDLVQKLTLTEKVASSWMKIKSDERIENLLSQSSLLILLILLVAPGRCDQLQRTYRRTSANGEDHQLTDPYS